MASLEGRVIAYLEARMRSEMGSLIERHGGVPYSAPVLQENYLTDSPQVRQLVDDVCAGSVEVVVLLTGVGTRALVEAAGAMGRREEFLQALDRSIVIARSPKPARVLRQHHIHIDLMPPEPFTSQDLVQALDRPGSPALDGKELAIQAYGGPNGFLSRSLQERGAQVREVSLYSWGLPGDAAPVMGLIDDLAKGEVQALLFTSQPQVGNLLTIASQQGQEERLRAALSGDSVAVASVGPVCTRRLTEAGFRVDVEPIHPHMGNLVISLADYFQEKQAQVT